MATPKVLVTGFPVFSNNSKNISELIVKQLSIDGIEGVELETDILSVDEVGASKVASQLREGDIFDAILHLGLAAKRQNISLERFGKNQFRMNEEDNSGRIIKSGEIIEGGTDRLETTVSIHVFDEEFDDDENICWSEDAGGYVCNETIYRTLNEIIKLGLSNSNGRILPAIFIHLPPEESLELNVQINVVKRIVNCLVNRPYMHVVGALLFNSDQEILACRRPIGDVWEGWWEFPGGKVDGVESDFEALRRELDEELGVLISKAEPVENIIHEYDDRTVDLRILNCGIINPNEVNPTEHDKIRWLSKNELLSVKWLPADLPIIQEWQSQGLPSSS
ncbi:MAG: hypothetical protein CXT72_03140 [Methanobacteriota archaeon]|jgi:8-oxo-dGTP diphosphatase|nr:MAG: hypothetical protein CXT72_03140 [Euryarchaeota archaeon]HIE63771.1 NUDIX domain-containing protein [Candidatus Poseidoniales archaeon]HIK99920.1 NUDIX domain-containing protein [Candidatus Poseidoniales archaeon]